MARRTRLCSLTFCDNKHYGKGYCATHHAQVFRYKIEPRPIGAHWEKDCVCSAPWCDREITRQRKLCTPCYKKLARYGLTVDEYVMLKQSCEVCGANTGLHIDHDHKTGNYRGMLCRGCNTSLGQLNESPERIRALARYIEEKNVY